MSAVAGILLLVIMGSRFIRYFSDAAEGDIPVTILGSLMVFHLPGFMELVLPLAFFLGILLAYGQMYMNSEITVMVACGMSPLRLLRVTLLPASVVAVLVGFCSLWLTPPGRCKRQRRLKSSAAGWMCRYWRPGDSRILVVGVPLISAISAAMAPRCRRCWFMNGLIQKTHIALLLGPVRGIRKRALKRAAAF